MKKSLLIVGLLLAMSLTASAQYKGFSFGFKLGPGFDWTGSTTGAAVNAGTRTGFGVGLVAEYYFAENYAFVTGVNVNMNRGHYTFENGRMVLNADSVSILQTYPVERYYKSTVYEIPLMLKMVTSQFGSLPIRYYAQVGGGIGYAQKVLVRDGIDGGAVADAYTTTDREFSNLRVSLKIGTGAQYAIDETMRAFLGLYFSHDFINNINSITPNYYGNYYENGNNIGDRENKLNLLQNRIGIEAGILF